MRIENLAGDEREGGLAPENSADLAGVNGGGLVDRPLAPLGRGKKVKGDEAKSTRPLQENDGQLVITDIRQGVKNPNCANIFINGKYSFSLDITQLVDFRLKNGVVVSEEELAELKKASEFGKLYQRALEWVLMRPRSVRETRDYLNRKIYDKKLDKAYIETILSRLEEKKYLSDENFARWYVENRFVKKGVSQKRLKMELFKKGISAEIAERTLAESERDEVEEARKMIAKKRARYDDEKLIAYLCRQGFSYQLVRSLIQDSEKD